MGWQVYERVKFLPKKITSVGIHSFHGWDKKKTTINKDVKPPNKLIDHLNTFRSVNAVSKRLTSLFSKHGVNVTYTPNGVDTEIFQCKSHPPLKSVITVGYSGSKAHDWRKGVSKYVIPAAKKARVNIKIAMSSSDKYVPLEEMHGFYNEIDCYVCASMSEGMSLSVLEASACGRPVIGTMCSGNTEIIKDGETGFFVDRSVSAIAEKIVMLKKDREMLSRMSKCASDNIRSNWGWNKQSLKWINFMSQI